MSLMNEETKSSKMKARMKKRTVTTGCGQGTVFGDLMEEIDSLKLRDDVRLSEETLYALLDAVRRHETIYKSAGAVRIQNSFAPSGHR